MYIFRWFVVALIATLVGLEVARADALDSWTTWSTNQPYVSKQVPPSALVVRGEGTDAYYVLEANPATGEIPVDIGGAQITVDFSGPPGSAPPADAAYVAGTDGSTLRGIKTDSSGELQVDVL